MKQSELIDKELGRAVGVKQMAEVAIKVFDKIDRETNFQMPMWAYKALRTPLGQAEDYLADKTITRR